MKEKTSGSSVQPGLCFRKDLPFYMRCAPKCPKPIYIIFIVCGSRTDDVGAGAQRQPRLTDPFNRSSKHRRSRSLSVCLSAARVRTKGRESLCLGTCLLSLLSVICKRARRRRLKVIKAIPSLARHAAFCEIDAADSDRRSVCVQRLLLSMTIAPPENDYRAVYTGTPRCSARTAPRRTAPKLGLSQSEIKYFDPRFIDNLTHRRARPAPPSGARWCYSTTPPCTPTRRDMPVSSVSVIYFVVPSGTVTTSSLSP
ncbi:hypothetical protein EVAR_64900_1 [Eumeta japonica]|uniref:Uncharacterized protein n=1 Tax=Eumeta variegata TaxID=151549 RepID=A0A4C1ZWJ6_EUMVA|nr:hypothetical protein EVAR_64900_1 [Eumeta japonica]